jgi:hypothetical protein
MLWVPATKMQVGNTHLSLAESEINEAIQQQRSLRLYKT